MQNVEARRDRDRRGLCGRSLRRSVFRACGSWWIDEELTCAVDRDIGTVGRQRHRLLRTHRHQADYAKAANSHF